MKQPLMRIGLSLGLGLSLALLLLTLLARPISARAAMLCVAPSGEQGCAYTTLQAAVNAAAPGDVITVTAGVYTENVVIDKPLTFFGAGAASTIVDGSGTDRVFSSTADLTLAELTVQNGYSINNGGGIFAAGALTLTKVNVLSNTVTGTTQGGGGAYAAGPVTLVGGVFRNNQASGLVDWGGGLLTMAGGVVTDTQFISNTAWDSCGGALIFGKAVIANALFQYNRANFTVGGGLCALDGVTLSDTQFLSNTAAGRGGGLLANANATLSGGLFAGNQSTYNAGGGLYASGALTLTDVNVLSNTAVLTGGGVYAGGPVVLSGGSFQHNQSGTYGGGLAVNSTLALTDTQLISNTAGESGGGAFAYGPATISSGVFQNNQSNGYLGMTGGGGLYAKDTLDLTDTQFINNTALNLGGGAYAFSAVTVSGGLFQGNTCPGEFSDGGGLRVESTLTLTGTKFISNTAGSWGYGGGLVQGCADGHIVNALFVNNSGRYGAAMGFACFGMVNILHTTIANSTLGTESAIFVAYGTAHITNTIVTSYVTAIEVAGGSVTSDYNLFYHAPTALPIGAHSLTGTNPLFVDPLVGDYHLAFGSPAAAAGLDVGVTTDLDGNPRTSLPSLGAYNGYAGPVYRLLLPLVRR